MNFQFLRDRQKIASILARHVGYAADLPFAPKQLVVVKRRHLVEVDSIDRHHAPLAQSRQGAHHYLAAGRKRDRPIQLYRRHLILFAHPGCAERGRHLAMGLAPRGDINFALPRLQNGDGETRRTAEAIQSHPLARFNPGHTQAAKADDAGTQQGSDVHVV